MPEFQISEVVWAHVVSYPWWPAEIVEEDDPDVPDAVLEQKPSNGYYLVRFINRNGDEFFWYKENDKGLKPFKEFASQYEKQKDVWSGGLAEDLQWSINEARKSLSMPKLEKPKKRKRTVEPVKKSTKKVKKSPASPKKKKSSIEPISTTKAKKGKSLSPAVDAPMEDFMDKETGAGAAAVSSSTTPTETMPNAKKPHVPVSRKVVKQVSNHSSPVTSGVSPSYRMEKEPISDEDLQKLYDQLLEAIEEEQSFQLVKILKHIDERCIIEIEQLRKIKIAKEIKKLRKHSNKQVRDLAMRIHSRFKTIVERKNNQKKTQKTAPAPISSQPKQPSGDKEKEVSMQERRAIKKDIEERVSTQLNLSDKLRAYFITQIAVVLSDSKEKIEKSVDISSEIESHVYKLHMEAPVPNKNRYKSQLKSIKFNLGDKKNPELKSNVEEGVVEPEKLASMTPQDMASKQKKAKRQEIIKEEIRKSTVAKPEAKSSGLFKCFKCKSNKISTYQLQTRSADEPMTVFCQCTNCGNRWKS